MAAKLFLDERNLKQLGFTEPNVRTMRALTEFLNVQNTVTNVVGPLEALTTTGILTRVGPNQWATRTLTEGTGLNIANGDGLADNPTVSLEDTAVTPGSYGGGDNYPTFTVDQQGRLTVAGEQALPDIAAAIGDALVAGTNITITDNGNGTFTIAASGGGSGAWTLISDQVLAADGTFTDFTSIPATYRDLFLVIRGRGSAASTEIAVQIRLNGDTGTNYDYAEVSLANAIGIIQTFAAAQANIGGFVADTAPAGTASVLEAMIPDYRGTTFHKSIMVKSHDKRANTSNNLVAWESSAVWRSTAAVTQITNMSSFKAGSIASLYGRS